MTSIQQFAPIYIVFGLLLSVCGFYVTSYNNQDYNSYNGYKGYQGYNANNAYTKRSSSSNLADTLKYGIERYHGFYSYTNGYGYTNNEYGYPKNEYGSPNNKLELAYYPKKSGTEASMEDDEFTIILNSTNPVLKHLKGQLKKHCHSGDDTFSSQFILAVNPNQELFYAADSACGETEPIENTFKENVNFKHSDIRLVYMFQPDRSNPVYNAMTDYNVRSCPEQKGVVALVRFCDNDEDTGYVTASILGCITHNM